MSKTNPRQALFGANSPHHVAHALPVCEHYAGTEAHMRKALKMQAQMGPLFDVTLDLENGAPWGAEIEQAQLIRELLDSADNAHGRVGVRLLPVGHRHFADAAGIVLRAQRRPAYLTCPKLVGLADVQRAADALNGLGASAIPLHALIETHGALRDVAAIASHPRIEALSFGLMGFVAAHHGAIPASAMTGAGQFDHPLVVRAKLEIAAACHAAGKTATHSPYADIHDAVAVQAAADMASNLLGFTRMCSIHPAQIRSIVAAFAPSQADVDTAISILQRAQDADWGAITFEGRMQDRASYRAWWHVLERADRIQLSGAAAFPELPALPAEVLAAWFSAT